MKIHPIIGEKYFGPCFDRPALRRMPHGWSLSDSIEEPRDEERILVLLAGVCALALFVKFIWETFL